MIKLAVLVVGVYLLAVTGIASAISDDRATVGPGNSWIWSGNYSPTGSGPVGLPTDHIQGIIIPGPGVTFETPAVTDYGVGLLGWTANSDATRYVIDGLPGPYIQWSLNFNGVTPSAFTIQYSEWSGNVMTYSENDIWDGSVATGTINVGTYAGPRFDIAPVPEPITMIGAFLGISSLAGYIRKRTKKATAV